MPLPGLAEHNHKTVEKKLDEEQLKKIFQKHDANGDNRLSKKELKKAFEDLNSLIPGFRAWLALQVADSNKDKFIDEHEMDILVKHALRSGFTVN